MLCIYMLWVCTQSYIYIHIFIHMYIHDCIGYILYSCTLADSFSFIPSWNSFAIEVYCLTEPFLKGLGKTPHVWSGKSTAFPIDLLLLKRLGSRWRFPTFWAWHLDMLLGTVLPDPVASGEGSLGHSDGRVVICCEYCKYGFHWGCRTISIS